MYYLHFETKPSFDELDVLFEQCSSYEPIMASSYTVAYDTEGKRSSFFDLVHQCFPRYHYAVMQFGKNNFRHFREAGYVTHGQ